MGSYQAIYNLKLRNDLIISPEFKKSKLGFKENGFNFCAAMPDYPKLFWKTTGLQIIANQVAKASSFNVDFAFLPDNENALSDAKKNGLTALYSDVLVREADIIGISIMNPLVIFNMFLLLELIGIPLLRKERSLDHPLIVAGNSGIINPSPFESFIDVFVIGDGEKPVIDIVQIYEARNFINKPDLLKQLAKIEGVYIPYFTKRIYNNNSELVDVKYSGNKKGKVCPVQFDFSDNPRRSNLIVKKGEFPIIAIDYSCKYKCGFCQMSNFKGKYKKIYSSSIKKYLKEYDDMGVDNVAIAGSCVGLYRNLDSIFNWANKELKITKPFIYGSLRSDDVKNIYKILPGELIIAPETWNEYLRNKILLKTSKNKEIINDIEQLIKNTNVKRLKIFIIIGIPTESEKDRRDNINLFLHIGKIFRKNNKRGTIIMKLSPLVPYPGTPFEEYGMMGVDIFKKVEKYYYDKITDLIPTTIKFEIETWNYIDYIIQGLINTGDTWTGEMIFEAYKNGASITAIINACKKRGYNRLKLAKFIPKGNWRIKPWVIIKSRNDMCTERAKKIIIKNIQSRIL